MSFVRFSKYYLDSARKTTRRRIQYDFFSSFSSSPTSTKQNISLESFPIFVESQALCKSVENFVKTHSREELTGDSSVPFSHVASKSFQNNFSQFQSRLDECQQLTNLANQPNTPKDLIDEVNLELPKVLEALEQQIDELKTNIAFNPDQSKKDCYLEISAGAGGADSMDFVYMLQKMYLSWAKSNKKSALIVDESFDMKHKDGLKNCTIRISNSLDFLQYDIGVHRLVRISPFDSKSRRHTSFASIVVEPVIDDRSHAKLELAASEYRVDTYRASGAGGQHVNTTDSAVRLTHLATGIVAQCQNERSQHANRRGALELLHTRLTAHWRREAEQAAADARGAPPLNSFGSDNLVRTYQLHPDTRIRCHISDTVATDVNAVLNEGRLETWWKAIAMQRFFNLQ